MSGTASISECCNHLPFGFSRESGDRSTEGDRPDLPDLADPTLLPREPLDRSTEVDRLVLRTEELFAKTAMSALAFEEELEARES